MKKLASAINIFFVLLFAIVTSVPQKAVYATGTTSLPLLFGAYPDGILQDATSGAVQLTSLNNWLTSQNAAGVTFAGDFLSITLNPNWNVPAELESAWYGRRVVPMDPPPTDTPAGFVPFINLMPSDVSEGIYYDPHCVTASDIANGNCDAKIKAFADAFKAWANKGGGRRAYIAPLPEANGDWIGYSTDGPTFALAFDRIRSVFEADGVTRSTVRWVFAPNGWSDPATPWRAFENYYPGDTEADVVAFSSYNVGGCTVNPSWQTWGTFEEIYQPYLDRMRVMAPSKPIFISQIGTTDVPDPDDPDLNQNKSYWINDTFSKLANYPAVRAIIYFNKAVNAPNSGCYPTDFKIYNSSTNSGVTGFLSVMKDATRFGKWSITNGNWSNVAFTDPAYTFADVMPTHPFAGEPNVWYYTDVLKLYNSGITGGCATSPLLLYCPNGSVTRAQMAVFLLKGIHTSSYSPPGVGGSTGFTDVSITYWAATWIKQLAVEGITGGCGAGVYCPESPVTRAQMAVFLLRSKHGSGFAPPAVGSDTGFTDVPTSYWAAAWIKQLAAEGITSGCGGGNFCPNDPVTRAQMAIFLVKTFSLP